MTRRVLIIVLILVVIGGLVYLASQAEYEEVEIEVGFSGEAALNPYLAQVRLFERLGLPVASVRGPFDLPPDDHVLFLTTPRPTLGPERAYRILDWVDSGGHLVVAAGEPDEDDPLLEVLGISVEARKLGESTRILDVEDPPYEVSFDRGHDLVVEVDAVEWLVPEDEPAVARVLWGSGTVTVLVDGFFLENSEIGENDHARFAWWLATNPDRGGSWVVFREDVLGLGEILWKNARPLVIALLVLLGGWLWSRAVRFGPLLPGLSRDRRSLVEHIEATGDFLWRRGEQRLLLDAVRQEVVTTFEHRHVGGERLTPRQLRERLAEVTGFGLGQVSRALEEQARPHDRDQFTRLITTLERMRRKL